MRTVLKWSLRLLIALVLAALVVGFWQREQIMRLMAVNSLFEADKIVANFSDMKSAFLWTEVPRGDGPVSPLAKGPNAPLPEGFDAWIKDRHVTALVVLKDGALVHESYYKDTAPEDLRISWSVAKSYISVLMGIVLEEGHIASLDDPVTKYVPTLVASAYNGVSIRNVLQMSSGVTFNEDYFDYDSDINRMGRVLALGGTLDDFTADLKESFTQPGSQMQYVSIDTHVLGMVIRGATGRSIADLLSEKVIAPLGLEQSPYYVTDGAGAAFVLGGLNIRTRDYARFGQMVLQDGEWQGQQIVSAQWLAASTAPSANTKAGEENYGYQWWLEEDAPEGEVYGRGVYGQYIFIDRANNVVIAANGADRQFRSQGAHRSNIEMFRAIAAGL